MIQAQGARCFKSLTTDNGAEFSTLSRLENSLTDTLIFFTHAYAAWEKGTNERHNRILREFLPKGMSLKPLTYKELQVYTETINNRFRKNLDYRCPNDLYAEEVQQLAA